MSNFVKEVAKCPDYSNVVWSEDNPFFCEECLEIHFPYKPIRDIVFIYPTPPPETFKGSQIVIPEDHREFYLDGKGIVVAVGPGYYDKKLKVFRSMQLEVGDRVIYDKTVPWVDSVIGLDGKEHVIVFCGEQDVWMKDTSDALRKVT